MLRSTDEPGNTRRGDGVWLNVVLTTAFYLLFLVQLIHHNLWRDELNAFGLALASPTLGSLFYYLHYEGHPWLWYFVLWVVSRFTTSAAAIKVIEACIVAATYGLLGLRSPFSQLEKTFIFLSYFVSFEYAVLSRMYSLLLLLLFVYLWRRGTHPEQFTTNCILLGVLPNIDTLGLLLSISLLLEYSASCFFSAGKIAKKTRLLGFGIYITMAGLAILSARPAADIGWRTTGYPFTYIHDAGHLLLSAVSFIAMPIFPAAFGNSAPSFWNPVAAQHPVIYLAGLPLVLAAYLYIFRGHRSLLLLVCVSLLLAVAFGHLIFLGTMRHWGITFLSFIAALWLLRGKGDSLPSIAYFLLGLNALAGIYTVYAQWQGPFSNAGPAAAWLRINHLENAIIIGTPDTTIASLAVLLHRPVYMLDCNCMDSYVMFSTRRDQFSRAQIPDGLSRARRSLASDSFLYIDAYPITQATREALAKRGVDLHEVAAFKGAASIEEDFYIYRSDYHAP